MYLKNLMWKLMLQLDDNALKKYMALVINKSLVFIDSMQFMNSSLEKLVKVVVDDDFKFLTQEFGSKT